MLAQINGEILLHGIDLIRKSTGDEVYGKYNTTPIDKLKLDLTYIQEYSYRLDLKLLLLTFRIVFRKESSEGVDKNQQTALKDKNEKG